MFKTIILGFVSLFSYFWVNLDHKKFEVFEVYLGVNYAENKAFELAI